jgi:hypothetical protein
MELVNATRMAAEYTLGLEPSGRERLVVVVKGTFAIPEADDEPVRLAAEQVPILLADVLGGESSALPVDEADLAIWKPRCDVLVKGSAHAPGGQPATRVEVGVRVGSWTKTIDVVGDRQWISGPFGARASSPAPFDVMPVTYERAFGGINSTSSDPKEHSTYLSNPIGRGYHRHFTADAIQGAPMPNTEQPGRPVEKPAGAYAPMALGPVGRNWLPRYRLAGTYDQRWLDEHFPFLPPDFDVRYHQAAPEDQQIPYPVGGEEVVLVNLSPNGRLALRLPRIRAAMTVAPRHGEREVVDAVIDTLVLDPGERRFTMTWRYSRPLRRSLFEIDEVIVGRAGPAFLRERDGLPLPVRVDLVHVATADFDDEA